MKHQYHKDHTLPTEPGAIFVFGSNRYGLHAGGAAQVAVEKFGAIDGQSTGQQGSSYAVVTADGNGMPLPLKLIRAQIDVLLDHAVLSIPTQFFITRIGCGIVGYRDDQIAPMFKNAPPNCSLPEEWKEWVE